MSHDASAKPALTPLQQVVRAAGGDAELVATVAEHSADAVFMVDAEHNIVLFNRQAEALTGFARDEVLGRHCLAGIRCETCLESCRLFALGTVEGAELSLYRKDGSSVEVRKDATVLRGADGRAVGALEVLRRAAPTGEAHGAEWGGAEGVMASLGRGLVLLDRSFRVRAVSARLAELSGRTARALVGVSAAEVLGPELFAAESAFRLALVRGERREGWRGLLTRDDGARLPVSVSGAPLARAAQCGGEALLDSFVLMVRPEAAEPLDEDGGALLFEGMVGRSPVMRRVFELIEQLQASDVNVVIMGESGTGKELVARALHARSPHAARPFVAINCGALPAALLESELFGHARGAFTGALRDKAGRFEVVEDGTLLLDEIGDLSLELQVKLLRVLQERVFERVGEVKPRLFRGRVIAATHHDLPRAVAARTFREDLFYRLDVVQIRLPPLRERREDIEPLIAHLLDKIGRRRSRALRVSPSAMRLLLSHDWPGNVRQLENALEYATAVCDGQTIHVEDLPPELSRPSPPSPLAPAMATSPDVPPVTPEPLGAYPSAAEIVVALKQTRHKKSAAATLLGISRTTLWRRMRELGLA